MLPESSERPSRGDPRGPAKTTSRVNAQPAGGLVSRSQRLVDRLQDVAPIADAPDDKTERDQALAESGHVDMEGV
jgi:hypothetical protein